MLFNNDAVAIEDPDVAEERSRVVRASLIGLTRFVA
jgi:hypothetical protein